MTTRQFNLMGDLFQSTTAIITIGGVEVFNGALTGDIAEQEIVVAAGNLDIINPVDGSDIVKAVSITVVSGLVSIGMFRWDYGMSQNTTYTQPQMDIVNNPASTPEQLFEVFNAVATPPFSSADLDIFTSTDPADDPIKYALLYEHKCFPQIQYSNNFAYGVSQPDIDCNRSNAVLNGTPYTEQPLYFGITMTSGDVLTFDTNIFASNIGEQYPG